MWRQRSRISKAHENFRGTGFQDPYHLFTSSPMTKVTLEELGVWLNPQLVSSNSESHAATLPLLRCFCITSGMRFYRSPRQQLARFYFGQSPLRNWCTDRSPARVQGKAAQCKWVHTKSISHLVVVSGEKIHTCTPVH